MWKFLLVICFPVLEIYLLIKVGSIIGAMNMVLWIFASALFGIWYARAHSQYSMMQMRADIEQGKLPQNNLMDSVLISLGGILLVLPGLITDALGLLLIFPLTRHLISKQAGQFFQKRAGSSNTYIFTSSGNFGSHPGQGAAGPERGSVFDATASPVQPEGEEGPRQIEIIDSFAIEIEKDDDPKTDDVPPSGSKS